MDPRHGDVRSTPMHAAPELLPLLDVLFDRLHPICRSITGPGLRETLDVLGEHMALERIQVPSGTKVLDWEVPEEWRPQSASLTGPDGTVITSFDATNLAIVNYSDAVDVEIDRDDLLTHLHTVPTLPDATPYVTSYYRRTWGFCLPQRVVDGLAPGIYRARIDTMFVDGALDMAHASLPGRTSSEVLLSTYCCHPSLANNELSGPLVMVALWHLLSQRERRFTYRFVVAPETIGSICYLDRFGDELMDTLHAGLVLTCLGGPDLPLSYKRSRRGNSPIDVVTEHVFRSEARGALRPFDPSSGSDERQFCSPGFDLPVGQMSRMVYGQYAGYHNSFDTKEAMGIDALVDSARRIDRLLQALEIDGYYVNQNPYGEPKLDKHGLYPTMNSENHRASSGEQLIDGRVRLDQMLHILSGSDGVTQLSSIADVMGCGVLDLDHSVRELRERGLLAGPFDEPNPLARPRTRSEVD